MTMHIDRIIGHIVEVKIGFNYAMGNLESAQSIIWEICAGKYRGIGEAGWSSELTGPATRYRKSLDGMASTLTGRLTTHGIITPAERRFIETMARPMLRQDPLRREALLPALPAVFNGQTWMIREGLSIALSDLAGRVAHAPVHALLGGKRRDCAPGMPVVHVGPVDVMVRRALKWSGAGYKFIKVKMRGVLAEDVAALRAIRKAVGPAARFQVDANDGYARLADAVRAVKALAPCKVDLFEDMLNAPLAKIAALRRQSGQKIMVDKESFWPQVHDVIRLGAADTLNHHPNLRGGLDVAMRIDAVAMAAGIPTAIGSSGTFGIQDAAFQALGAVIGLTRPIEDIGLQPYYSGPTRGEYDFNRDPDLLKQPYPIKNGIIQIPDLPGLGVELDRKKLARATIGQFEIA